MRYSGDSGDGGDSGSSGDSGDSGDSGGNGGNGDSGLSGDNGLRDVYRDCLAGGGGAGCAGWRANGDGADGR